MLQMACLFFPLILHASSSLSTVTKGIHCVVYAALKCTRFRGLNCHFLSQLQGFEAFTWEPMPTTQYSATLDCWSVTAHLLLSAVLTDVSALLQLQFSHISPELNFSPSAASLQHSTSCLLSFQGCFSGFCLVQKSLPFN